MAAKLSAARNWAAAKKQWQLAADRYAALDDLPGQAIALHNLAQSEYQLGEFSEAQAQIQAAAELNQQTGRTNEWWRNQILQLQLEAAANAPDLGPHLERLTPQAGNVADQEIQGCFLNERALFAQRNGEFDQAFEDLRLAAEAFQKARSAFGHAVVLANRAALDSGRGKQSDALRDWSEALQSFEKLADERGIARANLGLGKTLLAGGNDLNRAAAVLSRAADAYRYLKMPGEESDALGSLLKVAETQGNEKLSERVKARLAALVNFPREGESPREPNSQRK